ncbi:MAG: sigma-70 family RNA polymerase sigma factor, partial [Gammaproteobacteria bacterium]|nr:sigma-70 family RNA polymerase sigma factor [Gammaproteobacteria bacterium]
RFQNTQETSSDEELMTNYSLGDMAAFDELYHRNKAALYRYFLRQTRQAALAEEFAHEVWLRVINARQSYLPKAKFTTYLFQIAHNCLVDHFRKLSTSHEIDCGEPFIEAVASNSADDPEAAAGNTQIQRALLRLIQELPAEQREVFLLKEEANLSIEEIASVISENPETVKSRMRYAVKKLKEGLQEYMSR